MADILLRNLSPEITERVKSLARQRRCSIEDVIVQLLRNGLGLEPPQQPVPGDLAHLTGTFQDDEAKALTEAIAALECLPDDTFLEGEARPPSRFGSR